MPSRKTNVLPINRKAKIVSVISVSFILVNKHLIEVFFDCIVFRFDDLPPMGQTINEIISSLIGHLVQIVINFVDLKICRTINELLYSSLKRLIDILCIIYTFFSFNFINLFEFISIPFLLQTLANLHYISKRNNTCFYFAFESFEFRDSPFLGSLDF